MLRRRVGAYAMSLASSSGVQLPLTSATGWRRRRLPVLVVPGRKDQLSAGKSSSPPEPPTEDDLQCKCTSRCQLICSDSNRTQYLFMYIYIYMT